MKIFQDNGKIPSDLFNKVINEIGYILPASYLNLIQNHDGLYLYDNSFDFVNIYGDQDERGIVFLSYFEEDLDGDILSNQENINDLDNGGIRDLVVFGICGNGDYICFDYRDNPTGDNPKVVLVYHDDEIQLSDGSMQMVVNHVANSFDEFFDSLYEYIEE